jgi:S1-C subfamily serine protease
VLALANLVAIVHDEIVSEASLKSNEPLTCNARMKSTLRRFPFQATTTFVVTTTLALLGAGCVRRQQVPDDRMVQQVEQEASSGVVAIATTMADSPSHITLCSGALVAPNLVLTARHCVSRAVTATPSCDARGRSHNGDHLAEDVDPAAIAIYTGTHVRPDVDVPAARAVRTLHPTGQVLCDADVAFLVLDRPILNAAVLSMRLHSPVETGDVIMPVGFGGGVQNVVGLKVARAKSTILATGPSANAATGAVLGPREFEVDRATCRGDSGGPAIDVMTGEIVGIVSRGGSCSATGNHVYTRVDAYKRLAQAAFNAAEREPNVAARELPSADSR